MTQIKVRLDTGATVTLPIVNGPSIDSQVEHIANKGVWITTTRFYPPQRVTYIDVV